MGDLADDLESHLRGLDISERHRLDADRGARTPGLLGQRAELIGDVVDVERAPGEVTADLDPDRSQRLRGTQQVSALDIGPPSLVPGGVPALQELELDVGEAVAIQHPTELAEAEFPLDVEQITVPDPETGEPGSARGLQSVSDRHRASVVSTQWFARAGRGPAGSDQLELGHGMELLRAAYVGRQQLSGDGCRRSPDQEESPRGRRRVTPPTRLRQALPISSLYWLYSIGPPRGDI